MIIVEALREGRAVQRPPVQEVVIRTRSLPSPPLILTRVMDLINNERSEIDQLESLIRRDQSLSCRVLAAANSAYCGLAQKVETIGRAVVVLGYEKIRECCLGVGLMGLLNQGAPFHEREAEAMWKHSLATAEASAWLAKRSGGVEPELAFTAGLIHDLGKVALTAHMAQLYEGGPFRTWSEAEAILGFDHQELGLALAEHWRLPPVLAEVMARHHAPGPSLTYGRVVAAVHVGDCLAGLLGEGQPTLLPQPQAVDLLGLTQDDLNSCLKDLTVKYRDLEELWNSVSGGRATRTV